MEHIGIDLGAVHSHFVMRSETGEICSRGKVRTTQLPAWLKQQEKSHVVMEACTQSPTIARFAIAAGHETKVIPGHLVRALGVGARGIKTDDRDAEVLCAASVRSPDLPSVHLRSEQSRSRRGLLSARATLVELRKQIALKVKSWLRGQLLSVRGRAHSEHFAHAVRTVALSHPDGLPWEIELLLETYVHLCNQVDQLDACLIEISQKDATCRLLMSVPGVGPHISLAFMTHVDDPFRFASADELSSYLALSPGEQTTGGKIVRTRTLKAGPSHLKGLLVQAAWSMWRSRPNDPVVLWARKIADKRGNKIAIVALARKIATILWSMWKHERIYDPARASSVRNLAA